MPCMTNTSHSHPATGQQQTQEQHPAQQTAKKCLLPGVNWCNARAIPWRPAGIISWLIFKVWLRALRTVQWWHLHRLPREPVHLIRPEPRTLQNAEFPWVSVSARSLNLFYWGKARELYFDWPTGQKWSFWLATVGFKILTEGPEREQMDGVFCWSTYKRMP